MVDLVVMMLALIIIIVSSIVLQVCKLIIWRPYAVTKSFRQQGIVGPRYSLLTGSLDEIKKLREVALGTVVDTNSNDIIARVFPHYHKWFSEYGETFLYWNGMDARIYISDPELAKHVLSNKFGFYIKPQFTPSIRKLIGQGTTLANGVEWVRHRRIINPAFTMDKLKVMLKEIAEISTSMFERWKTKATKTEDQSEKIEIDMHEEIKNLTADVISHTAFGSSYMEGREAFKAQAELQDCLSASRTSIFIPGSQFLPTTMNIRISKLNNKVKNTVKSIVMKRLKGKEQDSSDSVGYGDDLLGMLIEASDLSQTKGDHNLNMDDIIEECKSIFLAGHETTANLLTWTVYLLSVHREWQDKLREEVLNECKMGVPDADVLTKLKLVHMVLLEALRLYSPAVELVRQGLENMKCGNIMIPKNTTVTIPVLMIHRDKKLWGEDADEFNPLRFMNGITNAAKHPNAFLAFGLGPRTCVGQTLALLEAKTVMAVMLRKYAFSLSAEYKHTPVDNISLQPQHGLPVILKPLALKHNN